MAFVVFQSGVLKLTVKYVTVRKDGVLFFDRRVPEDMQKHHNGKGRIRKSLKTKDPKVAAQEAARLAGEYDALWKSLRTPEATRHNLTSPDVRAAGAALLDTMGFKPGEAFMGCDYTQDDARDRFDEGMARRVGPEYMRVRHDQNLSPEQTREQIIELMTPAQREAERLFYGGKRKLLLSDALNDYLRLRGLAETTKPGKDATRSIKKVISIIGDLPLTALTRNHAREVRDALIASGNKTDTVRRQLNDINAIINKAIKEHYLDCRNPFANLEIPNEGEDAEERPPFTIPELRLIASAARAKDDDIRRIILMQLDTGTRAGEIIGLRIDDVVLDAEVPHLRFRFHKRLGRRLKTDGSERDVPLVGETLWAAERALAAAKANKMSGGWLFPRYISDNEIKATHAENAINKWLRSLPDIDKTSHSFRHAMRDRLRAVGAPKEIQDLIGGWGSRDVGQGYGDGYSLEVLRGHLEKVVLGST